MEVDPLYEHPEDGGLEAEHEQGQHHVAQPGLALVPGRLRPTTIVDVGLKVEDGGQVEEDQGDHEVLVDAEAVTLEGSNAREIILLFTIKCSHFVHTFCFLVLKKSKVLN